MPFYSEALARQVRTAEHHGYENLAKGAMSQQSTSFCFILPITRPQSPWNLKQAKKLHGDSRQTNVSCALLLKFQTEEINFEKL